MILLRLRASQFGNSLAIAIARVGVMVSKFMELRQILKR